VLRRLEALQPVGTLALRVVLGGIVLGYCVARFSGGMPAFTSTVASLGLPRWIAPVAAWTETLAALLLVIGLGTRLAAAIILLFMLIGLRIHFNAGLSAYDAYLSHAAMALAVIFFGAGPWSVDAKVRPEYGRRK
jgi:putative oxidoreductase